MGQVKFFKGCLPQIWLGPFLNILTHILVVLVFVKEKTQKNLDDKWFARMCSEKNIEIELKLDVKGHRIFEI